MEKFKPVTRAEDLTLIPGAIAGIIVVRPVLCDGVFHEGQFNAANDKISPLQAENSVLADVQKQAVREPQTVQAFLKHKIEANNQSIQAVVAQRPADHNSALETGAETGLALGVAIAAAGLTSVIRYGIHKLRNRQHRQPDSAVAANS
ncbi:MAG: hypothetical protein ACREGC_04070 [Minisyncoccia bacterium]